MDPMSSPGAVSSQQRRQAVDTESGTHEGKRRKVRKGTHSCWECKRRKMKCIFSLITSAACNGCRRRGSKCVRQEFPDEAALPMDKTTHDAGILVDQWIQHASNDTITSATRKTSMPSDDGRKTDYSILTPASMNSKFS